VTKRQILIDCDPVTGPSPLPPGILSSLPWPPCTPTTHWRTPLAWPSVPPGWSSRSAFSRRPA